MADMPVSPKKSLGQNFLVDRNIAAKIAGLISDNGNVVEIGPGTGSLTGLLLEKGCDVTAVEYDGRAVDYLSEKFSGNEKLHLLHMDFRDFDFSTHEGRVEVIGNIPYNISADIFFHLFEHSGKIEKAVLTVQKEVAMRLIAGPGSKDYGILAVAMKLCGEAGKAFDISPQCFRPAPKVTSSTVVLDFKAKHAEYDNIMPLVKAAFNQRRKMLRNSLKSYIETKSGENIDDFIHKNGLEELFRKRPEQLPYTDFAALVALIGK